MNHQATRARAGCVARPRQRGITLVELMVAMVLGLLVTASIGSVYLVASRNLGQQDAEARLQQSAAAAMAIVSQQIQKAGLVDMPAEWPGWQDATPSLDRFGYLMQNSVAATPSYLPVTLHGCDHDYTSGDNDLASTACSEGSTGSSAITLAWQVSRTGAEASAPVTTLPCLGIADGVRSRSVDKLSYLDAAGAVQSVSSAWTACRISLNPADPSIALTQTASPTSSKAEQTQSVADNVADMRLRYLVGLPGDSSHLSRYAMAADLSAAGTSSWADVTGIEVCLLARVAVPARGPKSYDSCETDPSTNAPVVKTVDDRFLYRAVRSVVVLRSRVQATSTMKP